MGRAPSEGSFTLIQAKCAHCGAPLPPSAQLCVECGTDLATGGKVASVNMEEIAERKTQKKKLRIIVAAAITAVALIVGLTIIFMLL